MSAELTKRVADVVEVSARGASGGTAAAGGVTLAVNPSTTGLAITVISFFIYVFLAWKKNKIYNLQEAELLRNRENNT